jgi:hypothetical protein
MQSWDVREVVEEAERQNRASNIFASGTYNGYSKQQILQALLVKGGLTGFQY